MSVARPQEDETIKELIAYFTDHQFITVTPHSPTNGKEAEVSYQLTGLIEDKEKISLSQHHAILLSIPFGFPLFPPNCKPLTPTFHPDFDPGAICLGNFWTDKTTCAELVEFISRMITGEVYSKENAFNERAAQWYAAHADNFPLAELAQTAIAPSLPEVREDDFSINFDAISLESSPTDEGQATTPDKERGYNLSLLQEYLAQKRFNQLNRELQAIPTESTFNERRSFQQRADKALLVAQKKQKEARLHEENGETQSALDKYRQALEEVSDLYDVKDNIKRLEQAIILEGKKAKNPLPTKESKKQNILGRISPLPTLILFAIISAIIALQFFKDTGRATSATGLYQQCITALERKEFRTAQALCESAQVKSSASSLFYGKKLSSIEAKSKEILLSAQIRQGLTANLSNKKGQDKKSQEKIITFSTVIAQVQTAITNRDWPKTNAGLRQARSIAKTDKEKKILLQTKAEISFYQAHERALTEYKRNGCKSAEPLLQTAQKKAQTLVGSAIEHALQDIRFSLKECAFQQLTEKGEKLYKTASWAQALPIYRDALEKIKDNPLAKQNSAAETENKISKIALYIMIAQGNEAFTNGEWEQAIAAYKRAITNLEGKGLSDPEEDSAMSSKKLKRIILQTEIIQNQQVGENYKEAKLFAQAIKTYQHIAKTIKQSAFAEETAFIQIQEEMSSDLKMLKNEQFVEEKRVALQRQQIDIFLENYPAATPETLLAPKILFIKDEAGKLIYRMEATDTSQNRPLTLVMYYAYNKATDQWQFAPRPEAD
ncbi:ubiquitin-conjugating enzyme E2 [Desulfotalea psychrophila]|uniref:UBC core domain-containing protein n=1 Tax=Desulfotalea psychrophila (strain LSv54 / DSM 12343) TaxID=177439 RepID=Q6AQ41_DESPS|nr:hypothetical protein [Desulfotalea psychrophila]CAG35532.1 unknown protein [Desulfotalea psychrophila LSv54]